MVDIPRSLEGVVDDKLVMLGDAARRDDNG